MTIKLKTEYATAERATLEEIKKQSEAIKKEHSVINFLDKLPIYVVVLNDNRQILFANKPFLEYLKTEDINNVIGQRPGEAVGCIQSTISEGGCGTSEFCKTCGAVNTILSSIENREPDTQECRIRLHQNEVLDLRVWAHPVLIDNEYYTIFSFIDISNEKRRKTLERIFFHDILNTAGGLQGFARLISEAEPDELAEYTKIMEDLSNRLIEEILAQKELSLAENNELNVKKEEISSYQIITEVVNLYKNHPVKENRNLIITSNTDKIISTDPVILQRIISNLIKNALEACPQNETVSIDTNINETTITFKVHNPTYIPRNIQLQIFQRNFSTKGAGRGLGTYSVKLLNERYLKGTVSFQSSEEMGTDFLIELPLE